MTLLQIMLQSNERCRENPHTAYLILKQLARSLKGTLAIAVSLASRELSF